MEKNRDRTFSLPPDVDALVDAVPVGQRSPWVAAAIREKAARVLELWAGGKRKGGLSRDAVARKLQAEGVSISAAQVDKITTRARTKTVIFHHHH